MWSRQFLPREVRRAGVTWVIHADRCADADTLLRCVERLSVPRYGVTMMDQMGGQHGADSECFAGLNE